MVEKGLSAILLAAGKGERLWPLTTTRPKPLLPVLCKPLLTTHLEVLYNSGVRVFVIVVSYMSDAVEKTVTEWARNKDDVMVKFVEQRVPLGTGHAVAEALRKENNVLSERLLIVYGDVYVDEDSYRKFISKSLQTSNYSFILGSTVDNVSRFGKLVVDDNGLLKGLVEKPQQEEPGIVNAGIYTVGLDTLKASLKELKLSPRGEYEFTDALKKMIERDGVKVLTFPDMLWSDVGTPWDYLSINRQLLERTGTNYISENANISENNVIEGPVFIDENVYIGVFNRIRGPTVLCRGVKIGFSVEVKSSVLLEGARIPHLSYVGDSVIGEDTNLGAGTVIANLRHDNSPVKTVVKGKLVSTGMRKFGSVIGGGAKTGINSSILPGVKIGANAWIGSGCIVSRDVPDNAIVKCSQNQNITVRD